MEQEKMKSLYLAGSISILELVIDFPRLLDGRTYLVDRRIIDDTLSRYREELRSLEENI
jgi:hypothetical protein